jgi:cytoskeletal protein CcmA (bactofilin family)
MEGLKMGIFGGEKKPMDHGAVDTIIGGKAKFKGELSSGGAVSVNGQFEGKISSKGEVIISKGSKITGDVNANHVIVSGKIEGNIVAAQGLEITKSGRVHGDLTGGKIVIEEGSSYRGRVQVESTGQAEEEATEEAVEEEILAGEEPAVAEETTQSRMF